MKHILIILLFNILLYAQMKPINFTPSSQKIFMKIKILDAKIVSFKAIKGIEFTEISDLAYDKKSSMLYGLSDHGYLYHMNLKLKNGKLKRLDLLNAYKLSNKKGKKLKKDKRDSEGLSISDKGLIISFEKDPKVSLFTLNGKKISDYKLQKKLRDIKNYKSENSALEAVTVHPKYGMITVPEVPLKKQNKKIHTLYAKKLKFDFKVRGSIKAIETMANGNILVLERGFKSSKKRRVVILTEVNLNNCKDKFCSSKVLARFDTKDGWILDNFEGLTRLNRSQYLMISDDNNSSKQQCIIVLFELR